MRGLGTRLFAAMLIALLAWSASAQVVPGYGSGISQGMPFLSPQMPGVSSSPNEAVPGMRPPSITNINPMYMAPGSPPAGPTRTPLPPRKPPSDGAPAVPEPNEFQEFIAASTGKVLPLYGQTLFQDVPSTFAPVEYVPVTADYVIGPGDELYVRAWGQVDIDYLAVVDRNGTISIPRVGVINVAGVRYQDLNGYIKAAVGRVFRNFDLSVTLGQLRSIQIFVVGQARRPGAYTVSSLSSLVNAVFEAGGPSSTGSMRNIQLRRAGKIITELDLYDLLIYGDKTKDAHLLPGDVIHFMPIGPLAAVSGSVNNPAVFELKGEVPLGKLVEWAGGLATTAQMRTATIERIYERRSRVVDKFSLVGPSLSRPMQDGDLVTVLPLAPRFENAVTLRGNVAVPLRHPFTPGMRVRDLIPDKEALITHDFYARQNRAVRADFLQERVRSSREATSNTLERPERAPERIDRPEQAQRDERRDRADATEQGDRRPAPGAASADPRLLAQQQRSTETAATPAQRDPRATPTLPQRNDRGARERMARNVSPERLFAEINWDYAVVERMSETDFSSVLIPFHLGKAILDNDTTHNIALRPGDIVTIFSKDDINVPTARQTKFIRLEGEFNTAGVFQAQPGETLRQLIARTGGVSPNAYVFGTEFTRESVRALQEKSYQDMLNRLERELQSGTAERARSTTAPEDGEALRVAQASQQATIARLRELRPTGRIALELPEEPKLADLPDIVLEDGDRVFIPVRPAMVNVFGSVFTEGSFLYRSGRVPGDYLSLAGGATKRADRGQIFVLRADGSAAGQSGIFASGSGPNVRVLPGDTIVVPEDYDRQSWTRILRDWATIFYQFGLGAAALKVLRD